MGLLFGYVVAAELDQLAIAEEVGTAVANIESDELVCFQGDTNNCRAHAKRFWMLLHEFEEMLIGFFDYLGARGGVCKPIDGLDQIIENGSAGQRALRVATHAVCDHQDAAIVRHGRGQGFVHVAGQNACVDGDGVLIDGPDVTAVGEGGNGPVRHDA